MARVRYGAPTHTSAYIKDLPTVTEVNFLTYITVPHAAAILGLTPKAVYDIVRKQSNPLHAVQTPLGIVIPLAAVSALRRERKRAKHGQQPTCDDEANTSLDRA